METYEQSERDKREQRGGTPLRADYSQPKTQEFILRHLDSIIAVDIDGTITEGGKWLGEGYFKPLNPRAKARLVSFKKKGYVITVYSVRADKERIANWLQVSGIPFDYIEQKPYFTMLIDDRAIEFEDWDDKRLVDLPMVSLPSPPEEGQ